MNNHYKLLTNKKLYKIVVELQEKVRMFLVMVVGV